MTTDTGACHSLCLNSIMCVFSFSYVGTQLGATIMSLSCSSPLISHSFGSLKSFLMNTLFRLSLLMRGRSNFAYLMLDFSDFSFFVVYIVAFTFCACRHFEIKRGLLFNSQADKHCVIFIGLSLVFRLSWTAKCQT